MQLIPFANYSAAIELVWDTTIDQYHLNNINTNTNILDRSKTLFIGTDDPNVLEEAKLWGKENNCKIIFTNLFDRSKQVASLNISVIRDKSINKDYVHDELEYVSEILNLEYLVRSDMYVCTLASNFCRLVDELRVTLGYKAKRLFADLSHESCRKKPSPPCIGDADSQYLLFLA